MKPLTNYKEVNMNFSFKSYAILSNENAPKELNEKIEELVHRLAGSGFTLRTSGSVNRDESAGIEDVAEKSTDNKEIYLAWKFFNKKDSKFIKVSKQAIALVSKYHPTFASMKEAVQTIIARYAHVLLGSELNNPVRFLLVWSADGCETKAEKTAKTGFVGVPIALANDAEIKVFNLARNDAFERLSQYLNS